VRNHDKAFPLRHHRTLLGMAAAIAPATAQFPRPLQFPEPPQQSPPVPSTPKGKKAPAPSGPSIADKWSGQLTQVGIQTPYKFELAISAIGAETKSCHGSDR
jgi:hypothetical protein